MSKSSLKDEINLKIRPNSLRQITGEKLNDVLIDIVDEMALQSDLNLDSFPIDLKTESPKENGIFQPIEIGVYENFGGLELTEEELKNNIVYFYYLDGVFSKETKSVLTVDEVDSEETNAVNGKAVFNYTNKTINTINDLRNYEGKDGQVITLLGYYESGDKESLNYKFTSDKGVDDGGSVINSSSGSWLVITKDSLNFKDFGAIPNNINEANNNFLKLVKAVDSNLEIYFEDSFYYNGNTTYVSTNNIVLRSETKKGVLINTRGFTLFSVGNYLKNIIIDNITFKTDDNTAKSVSLFIKTDYIQIGNIQITRNIFNNVFSIRLNGSEQLSEIGNLLIDNNYYENTRASVYNFLDVKFKTPVNIRRNNIKNMGANFFYSTFNSEDEFTSGNHFIINDNFVKNDIDFWGEVSSGLYYVFILVGGSSSDYFNNHVEGLKTTLNLAVYDIYQSTDSGNYYNNKFINNTSINTTYTDGGTRALYKAKAGTIKKCYNNTFIIEESYIDEISAQKGITVDKSKMGVTYVSVNALDLPHEIYFINNVVNVFRLHGDYVINAPCKIFKVSGNTFKANVISGSMFGVRYGNQVFGDRYYELSNNVFEASVGGEYNAVPLIVSSGNKSLMVDKVVINIYNNTLNNINIRDFIFGIKADTLRVNSNSFNTDSYYELTDRNRSWLREVEVINLESDNNIRSFNKYNTFFYENIPNTSFSGSIFGNFNFKFKVSDNFSSSRACGLLIVRDDISKSFDYNYSLLSAIFKTFRINYNIEYTSVNGVKTLKYTDFQTGIKYSIDVTNESFKLGNNTDSHAVYRINRPGTSNSFITLFIDKLANNQLTLSISFDANSSINEIEYNHTINKI